MSASAGGWLSWCPAAICPPRLWPSRAAEGDEIDPDLTNAGKVPVVETPGCSYFHHADSFAMMRGGHLDVCVLGAFQVSAGGDLANWHTGEPGAIPAVGGAMDLAIGAKDVLVMMTLFAKDGSSKLVPACTYPLTGVGCVSRVYTDLAVFEVGTEGVTVLETWSLTVDELAARLDVPLRRVGGSLPRPPRVIGSDLDAGGIS